MKSTAHAALVIAITSGTAAVLPALGGDAAVGTAAPSDLVGLPAWDVARSTLAADATFNGVTSEGGDSTWAVGKTGTSTLIERWNGRRFRLVESPNRDGRANVLEGVDGSAADDVWAVGHADLPDGIGSRTLIEHWDGSAWHLVASPNGGDVDTANTLTGVAAISRSDAWAVGTRTTYAPGSEPILLHWNGDRWRRFDSTCGPALSKVEARNASDVWAVGGADTCHFDGRTWKRFPAADPTNPQDSIDLVDVTIVSATNAWSVGIEYSSCGEGQVCADGVIEHWDGTKWHYVRDGVPVLYGVDALAANDIYAVGLGIGPAILHYDGSSWSEVPNPYEPAQLQSVVMTASHAWAVGLRLGDQSQPFAEQAPAPTSGAVVGTTNVSDATISWFGDESGTVQTDESGSYQIGGLDAGRYTITASYVGCQPAISKVRVQAGTTIAKDLHIDC